MDSSVDRFAEDKAKILALYTKSINEYGYTPRGITWGSSESQLVRFITICKIGIVPGDSVLDVGCGLGDFFLLLSERFLVANYLGVDINPELVQEATTRYPEGKFRCLDILTDAVPSADWVVESGALGIDTPHWWDHTQAMLRRMFELAKKGIACNFLSSYSPTKTGSHYADPKELFDFACRELSTKVVIRQDYKPNDFTMYVYH